jgi:hypothetical protein
MFSKNRDGLHGVILCGCWRSVKNILGMLWKPRGSFCKTIKCVIERVYDGRKFKNTISALCT